MDSSGVIPVTSFSSFSSLDAPSDEESYLKQKRLRQNKKFGLQLNHVSTFGNDSAFTDKNISLREKQSWRDSSTGLRKPYSRSQSCDMEAVSGSCALSQNKNNTSTVRRFSVNNSKKSELLEIKYKHHNRAGTLHSSCYNTKKLSPSLNKRSVDSPLDSDLSDWSENHVDVAPALEKNQQLRYTSARRAPFMQIRQKSKFNTKAALVFVACVLFVTM